MEWCIVGRGESKRATVQLLTRRVWRQETRMIPLVDRKGVDFLPSTFQHGMIAFYVYYFFLSFPCSYQNTVTPLLGPLSRSSPVPSVHTKSDSSFHLPCYWLSLLPSVLAAAVHLTRASAIEPRKAFRSISSTPWIVDPPGVATFSFMVSGVSPASISMAAPFMVSAAITWASLRLSPRATAPSNNPSMNRAKNAGVLPHSAVQGSNWAAVMRVTEPMEAKSHSTSRTEDGVVREQKVMTVVDDRTKEAVLGMARTMAAG